MLLLLYTCLRCGNHRLYRFFGLRGAIVLYFYKALYRCCWTLSNIARFISDAKNCAVNSVGLYMSSYFFSLSTRKGRKGERGDYLKIKQQERGEIIPKLNSAIPWMWAKNDIQNSNSCHLTQPRWYLTFFAIWSNFCDSTYYLTKNNKGTLVTYFNLLPY